MLLLNITRHINVLNVTFPRQNTLSIRTLFLEKHLQHVVSYMPNVFNTLLHTATCLEHVVSCLQYTPHNMTQCTLSISFLFCKTPAACYSDRNAL